MTELTPHARQHFDGIVFDLDGTLINSAPDIHAALDKLLNKEGRRSVTLEEVVQMIGDGLPKLVERGYLATGDLPEPDVLKVRTQELIEDYEANSTTLTYIYPGVIETLTSLAHQGLKLGLCTNKPEAATRIILEMFKMTHLFDSVVGGDTLDGIRKPDGRHVLAVVEGLGITSDKALMVGDNHNDVASARNAGLPVVAVSYGYVREDEPELVVDQTIDHFADLAAAINLLASS